MITCAPSQTATPNGNREREGETRHDRGKSAVESTDARAEGIVDDVACERLLGLRQRRRRSKRVMPLATFTVASSP